MSDVDLLLAILFFAVAVLYSSVGHAGASGYLAAMALLGFAPEQMRPTALALNILVASIGVFRFTRAGLLDVRKVAPFVLASAPATFFAARYPIAKEHYAVLLGSLLLLAALAIFRSARDLTTSDDARVPRKIYWPAALGAGALIGLLSGLTGTGGAIFLTPLLLACNWAHTREASGISVAFVLINSVLGLIGVAQLGAALPAQLPVWLAVVAVGALIGTQLGIHRLPIKTLRYALAAVLLIAAAKLLLG